MTVGHWSDGGGAGVPCRRWSWRRGARAGGATVLHARRATPTHPTAHVSTPRQLEPPKKKKRKKKRRKNFCFQKKTKAKPQSETKLGQHGGARGGAHSPLEGRFPRHGRPPVASAGRRPQLPHQPADQSEMMRGARGLLLGQQPVHNPSCRQDSENKFGWLWTDWLMPAAV